MIVLELYELNSPIQAQKGILLHTPILIQKFYKILKIDTIN